MNNYCTNCGNKLGSSDLVCKNCDTPVVDLPIGYEFKSKTQKANDKKSLKKIILIILFIVIIPFLRIVFEEVKIEFLKNKYLVPYIKEKYYVNNPDIKFTEAGRCIISGECYFNFGSGCDQSYCEPYKYLNRFKCKSYYFDFYYYGENHILTVFKKEGSYYVVEGKNIYGLDEYEFESEKI